MRGPLADELFKFSIRKREEMSVEWNFRHLLINGLELSHQRLQARAYMICSSMGIESAPHRRLGPGDDREGVHPLHKSYAPRSVRGMRQHTPLHAMSCRHRSRTCECIPIPALRTALIVRPSCPRGGASRGDPEVGQSESWPEGQPEGRCGAWGCARKHGPGRPWVSVRPLERVCHCELAGRGQASGAKTPVLKGLFGGLPSPRKNGPGF